MDQERETTGNDGNADGGTGGEATTIEKTTEEKNSTETVEDKRGAQPA